MKFLFTCGGTAGHINPGLAVAGRIRELMPDAEILFVGAEGHMETELVPREGYDFQTVRIEGFQRSIKPKYILKNIKTAGCLLGSLAKAKKIVRSFKPDVAVGTGGYVCYPVLRAAAAMGIPTAVHESNAVPGLTTRLLEKQVSRIMVGFEGCRSLYKNPDTVAVTGTPVRVEFAGLDRQRAREAMGLAPEDKLVLAAFGSLGASYPNSLMPEFIRLMGEKSPFRLVYATGRLYHERIMQQLDEMNIRCPAADVREYIYDMPTVMTAADVMICRSGASTISELGYLGLPAVIIPSPNVVNHHQEKNAAVLGDAGAAVVLSEKDLDAQGLFDAVERLLSSPETAAEMHSASLALGVNDATDRIASMVLGLAEKHKIV